MSPFGATATLVGRSKASGPVPATPGLPSVINTLPCGLRLSTFLSDDHARCIPVGHAKNRFLIIDVRDPQVSITIDREAVIICKEPDTKALQKLARRIEFQDWRIHRTTADT